MKEIDFIFSDDVVKQVGRTMNYEDCEVVRIFWPIYYLYRMYRLLSLILDKKHTPEEYDKMGMFHLEIEADLSSYHLIYAIMFNKIKTAERILNKTEIELDRDLSKTAVAWRLDKGNWRQIYNYTFLNVAAILGRKEIFKLLIAKGCDPGKLVRLSGMNSAPISLSVNECLIMNEMYHWYKTGMKNKLKAQQVNALIDVIALASQKNPIIVSDERLADPIIRVALYWYGLKEMVEDRELLKRLIPLNPLAMKENLDIA
ncbi:MAG: hypothetical protein CVU71_07205 [Deltaproteobacteria bacterium HGW-Deltaproteobacteria-6]|jgi:hypothetical protein|nr:MAG: hypothetical protein CVU71_07205 [Deltaproteobacteria bacterium HGW-Deltaproteobacteria-6]